MLIQHNIKTDLVRKGCDPIISIMQGDISTHQIVCTILKDRKKWLPPSGTTILVRYSNSYGTGCTYDTLPDGEPAWEINGNTVSVILVPQVLALPGSVTVVVSFLSGAQVLSVFKVLVMVPVNCCAILAVAVTPRLDQRLFSNGRKSTNLHFHLFLTCL